MPSARPIPFPTANTYMNGICERGNTELKTVAKALLLDSGLPPSFWAYALNLHRLLPQELYLQHPLQDPI